MFDKKFNIILGVFLALFVTVTYYSLSNNRLPFFTRASNQELDLAKSVVIISKLEILADGKDASQITVFARNSAGVGIPNKQISVSPSVGNISPASLLSDSYGKGIFNLNSSVVGAANLQVSIEGVSLPLNYTVQVVSSK